MASGFMDGSGPLQRLGRVALSLVPRDAMMPVLSGINRGYRWRAGAGIHRCWLGRYEADKLALLARVTASGATVYDVGAHAGYYSLAASRLVGPAGKVFAFEPDAHNLADLRRHLARNGLTNVTVVPHPVGQAHGMMVNFGSEHGSYQGHVIDSAGAGALRLLSLDGWRAESGAPMPDVIKMDVEGFEVEALDGAVDILSAVRTVWLIGLHGDPQTVGCFERLRSHGYRIFEFDGREIAEGAPSGLFEVVVLPPMRDPQSIFG